MKPSRVPDKMLVGALYIAGCTAIAGCSATPPRTEPPPAASAPKTSPLASSAPQASSLPTASDVADDAPPEPPEPAPMSCSSQRTPYGRRVSYPFHQGAVLDGVVVHKPTYCGHPASILLQRTAGTRIIATQRNPDGSFDQGCTELAPHTPEPECPEVSWALLATSAVHRMTPRDVSLAIGDGVCAGHSSNNFDDRQMSLIVESWADAEAAVRAMVKSFVDYDVRGELRVGIAGPACKILLGAATSQQNNGFCAHESRPDLSRIAISPLAAHPIHAQCSLPLPPPPHVEARAPTQQ